MIKKIVLIGAGNVATHLGSALCGAGCDVVQVYSRTKESAMELADKLSAEYTVSVDGIRCDADMYIVALKDSALQELLPMLVKGREQAFFVHTAGSMPMDIWKGYLSHYGVFILCKRLVTACCRFCHSPLFCRSRWRDRIKDAEGAGRKTEP